MPSQKNPLDETIILSTHNAWFGREIGKLIFSYTLLSGGLVKMKLFSKLSDQTYVLSSFEYLQHKFWSRNKKINYQLPTILREKSLAIIYKGLSHR